MNALETKFAATTAGFSITTRIQGPLSNLSANYENGGVFFGPDQDNYVKLIAGYNSTGGGQVLQFTDEQNATTHTVNTYLGIGSFASISTLDLRLTGNAGTGTDDRILRRQWRRVLTAVAGHGHVDRHGRIRVLQQPQAWRASWRRAKNNPRRSPSASPAISRSTPGLQFPGIRRFDMFRPPTERRGFPSARRSKPT